MCSICPSGRYNEDSGKSAYLHDDLADCTFCPVGKSLSDNAELASNHTSSSQCLRCPRGTFAVYEGTSTCTSCPAGSKHGACDKEPCPKDHFQAIIKGDNATQAVKCCQCLPCPPGQVTSSDGLFCAPSLVCASDEVSADDGCSCDSCSLVYSVFSCLFSAFSFAVAHIYVQRQSSNRASILQLKVRSIARSEGRPWCCLLYCTFKCHRLSNNLTPSPRPSLPSSLRSQVLANFVQVASLTTLISVPFPSFIDITLPFTFPSGSFACILSAAGLPWNRLYWFYLFLYLPLFFFRHVAKDRARYLPGTVEHVDKSQQLAMLVLLWYSPVLVHASEMISCFEMDRGWGETEWRLEKDPTVTCNGVSFCALLLGSTLTRSHPSQPRRNERHT